MAIELKSQDFPKTFKKSDRFSYLEKVVVEVYIDSRKVR